jgi:hypothetical protein
MSALLRKRWVLVVGGVGAVVVVAIILIWYQPQTLLINRDIDDALPEAAPAEAVAEPSGETGETAETAAPAAAPEERRGDFSSLSHPTTGTARLVTTADGVHVLRFEDLDTDNGPDLRVYLSTAPADGADDAFDDDFVDLGMLKGNRGNQNYEIPADVDVSRFSSAVIWCRRFAVGFGVAPLT